MTTRLLALPLIVGAFLLVAACDDGDETTDATPTSSVPTATSVATTPTAPGGTANPTAAFEGTRGPVEQTGAVAPPMPLLMKVRTGEHEGYDRITFEFEGERPGYRVEYVQPPITEDPSDLPVEVAGVAFLRIRLESASAHDEAGAQTVDVREIMAGLPSLLGAEQIGDFEGVVNWVLGLSEEVDFRVGVLDSPNRIYIDVLHP
ncbi:MAG: hypothetical protein WEE64_08580 [Dehalococcoidia bacterium]